MDQQKWKRSTSHLALAAAFAAGIAAAPFTIEKAELQRNAAAAQTTDDGGQSGDGAGGTGASGSAGGMDGGDAGDSQGDGAAEDFVGSQDPTPDIGGSGSPGVSTGEKRFDLTTINLNTPAFEEYKTAAERDDADAAARALSRSALADQAITPEMVEEVNDQLEVNTRLTPRQIAEAVNDNQPY